MCSLASLAGCEVLGGFDDYFIDESRRADVGGGGGQGGDGGGAGGGPGGCGPATLFVDASASGAADGRTWADAFPELSTALSFAETCAQVREIWVASGIYRPGTDASDAFAMRNGLALYGGFIGGEASLEERDVAANPAAVLSGDLFGDDAVVGGVVTDVDGMTGTNSVHVVTAGGTDATAILDGFTITAGCASVNNDGDGGGILIRNGGPTLRNLLVRGNRCIGKGGGLFSAGTPLLQDVVFSDNRSDADGGAIASEGGTITLIGATLANNRSYGSGGALYVSDAEPTVVNAVLTGNAASGWGGGVFLFGISDSDPRFVNVLMSGNWSDTAGGGLAFLTVYSFDLVNITVSGNLALLGGGMHVDDGSDIQLINSVIWGNTDVTPDVLGGSIVLQNPLSVTARFSVVQHSGGSSAWDPMAGVDGGNNTDVDPQFVSLVDSTLAPTSDGNYRLQAGSPAVDAGDNTANDSSTALAGEARVQGAAIDRGAYESF